MGIWNAIGTAAFTLLTIACGAAIWMVWTQTPVEPGAPPLDATTLALGGLAAVEAALFAALAVCWARLFKGLALLHRVRRISARA